MLKLEGALLFPKDASVKAYDYYYFSGGAWFMGVWFFWSSYKVPKLDKLPLEFIIEYFY